MINHNIQNSNMAMLSILPRELCILIDEMNPEHREKFTPVKKELELESVMNRINRTRNDWERTPDYERPLYSRLLIEEFTEPEEALDTLNNCNCCERHQTKKPRSAENSGGYNPFIPGAFAQLDYSCECECRHTSRMLYKHLINLDPLYDARDDDDYARDDDDDEDWYENERYW